MKSISKNLSHFLSLTRTHTKALTMELSVIDGLAKNNSSFPSTNDVRLYLHREHEARSYHKLSHLRRILTPGVKWRTLSHPINRGRMLMESIEQGRRNKRAGLSLGRSLSPFPTPDPARLQRREAREAEPGGLSKGPRTTDLITASRGAVTPRSSRPTTQHQKPLC